MTANLVVPDVVQIALEVHSILMGMHNHNPYCIALEVHSILMDMPNHNPYCIALEVYSILWTCITITPTA